MINVGLMRKTDLIRNATAHAYACTLQVLQRGALKTAAQMAKRAISPLFADDLDQHALAATRKSERYRKICSQDRGSQVCPP